MVNINPKLEISASNHDEYHMYYLTQHSKQWCRRMHLLGTAVAASGVLGGIFSRNLVFVGGSVVAGAAITFAGDFLIQQKNPAFLKHPIWATWSNCQMCWAMLKGDISI